MWYIVDCSSVNNSNQIIEKYPIIKNYKYKIDYPYSLYREMPRLLVKINDLVKFTREVNEEIIIRTDAFTEENENFVTLEIYDDWRE